MEQYDLSPLRPSEKGNLSNTSEAKQRIIDSFIALLTLAAENEPRSIGEIDFKTQLDERNNRFDADGTAF